MNKIPKIYQFSANLSHISRVQRISFLMLTCCTLVASTASAQDAKSVRATIIQAWKDREQQTETLDCRWSAQVCEGTHSTFINDERMNPIPFPPEDFFFETEYRFRFIGQSKYRYEYTGPQLNSFTKSYEVSEYTSVTDGEVQRSLFGGDLQAGVARFPAVGFNNVQTKLPEVGMVHLDPLFMLYRPFSIYTRNLDDFNLKGSAVALGRECLLFERITDVGINEVFIDMGRGCAPVAQRFRQKDANDQNAADWHVTWSVDIDLNDEPGGRWRPTSWKTVSYKPDGRILEQHDATVKELVINGAVEDSIFRIEFPVGAIVRDSRSKEYYILRERGEKRPITDAEQTARIPYKQLLATNPDGSLHSSSSRKWYFLVGFLAVGLLLIGLIRRYVRARKANNLNAQ